MKTYIKGIKTVAVIFLSLIVFSCQDEQIELQDTLSTESDQLMSRPGGKTSFNVSLNQGDWREEENGTLIVNPNECTGTSDKKNLLWFVYDCWPAFEVGGEDLFLQAISLGFGTTNSQADIQVIMFKGRDTYFGDWKGQGLRNFDSNGDTHYLINKDVEIWKKVKKGREREDTYLGDIYIGEIVIKRN